MSTSTGGLFVIVLALICANLPFVNQRVLALVPVRWPRKPFWLRGTGVRALHNPYRRTARVRIITPPGSRAFTGSHSSPRRGFGRKGPCTS